MNTHYSNCELHRGKTIVYPQSFKMPTLMESLAMAQGRLATGDPTQITFTTFELPSRCTCGINNETPST